MDAARRWRVVVRDRAGRECEMWRGGRLRVPDERGGDSKKREGGNDYLSMTRKRIHAAECEKTV